MSFFGGLYEKVLGWSRHRHAPFYLGGLSFAESSFFPIPPDVMLAPMSLARPERAFYYAFLTTLTSVIGGIAGYVIGVFAIDLIEPFIEQWGYGDSYDAARQWFADWGFWAIFLAGFSPIPYKIFTITAGAISMAFLPFVVASFIGRGARFFLVAWLMSWGGEAMEHRLRQYVDYIGWGLVVLVGIAIILSRFT
jgi:membrane protein YqaA with SNARE-associated domain